MDDAKVTERILAMTRERLFSEDFGNFTMEEVAAEAGVSKKTLYRLIPSKNDLIIQVVSRQIEAVEQKQQVILGNREMAFPEKLEAVIRTISDILVRIGRKTFRDMVRLSPDLWEMLRLRRLELLKRFVQVLEEGCSEGMVRSDIPSSFIARYFQQMIDSIMTPQVSLEEDLSPKELLDMMLILFFEGVMSPEKRTSI